MGFLVSRAGASSAQCGSGALPLAAPTEEWQRGSCLPTLAFPPSQSQRPCRAVSWLVAWRTGRGRGSRLRQAARQVAQERQRPTWRGPVWGRQQMKAGRAPAGQRQTVGRQRQRMRRTEAPCQCWRGRTSGSRRLTTPAATSITIARPRRQASPTASCFRQAGIVSFQTNRHVVIGLLSACSLDGQNTFLLLATVRFAMLLLCTAGWGFVYKENLCGRLYVYNKA